jgi:hypothetical protein
MPAVLTLIEGDPGFLGTALEDGVHGFAVLLWHVVAKALDILGAESPEEVIEVFHIKTPP